MLGPTEYLPIQITSSILHVIAIVLVLQVNRKYILAPLSRKIRSFLVLLFIVLNGIPKDHVAYYSGNIFFEDWESKAHIKFGFPNIFVRLIEDSDNIIYVNEFLLNIYIFILIISLFRYLKKIISRKLKSYNHPN